MGESQFIQLLKKYAETDISATMQRKVNTPVKTILEKEHSAYAEQMSVLMKNEEFNLLDIHSILQKAVYEQLSHEAQGIVEREGLSILHILRTLKQLLRNGYGESFQAKSLIEQLWKIKKRIESQYGDVYII